MNMMNTFLRAVGDTECEAPGCPQSYADRVAAEVAARYGAQVTGPVQIIPRGVSGLPDVMHQDNWRSRVHKLRANHDRVRRVVSAQRAERAEEDAPKVRTAPPRAARLIERDHLIRQLVAAGKTTGQIAREIGLTRGGAHTAIKALGLRAMAEVRQPRPKKAKPEPVGRILIDHDARASEIRAMVARGCDRAEIAAHFGLTTGSMKRMMNKYKIKLGKAKAGPDFAEIVRLYLGGMPSLAVAKHMHCGTAKVAEALDAAGIDRRAQALREVKAARSRVVDLHAQGKTILEIMAETGMSRKRVCLALERNGLEPIYGPGSGPRRVVKLKMISDQVRARILEMAAQRVGMKRIGDEVDLPWRRVAAIVKASLET